MPCSLSEAQEYFEEEVPSWPSAEMEEAELDLLPMIDIIFQLLIFFLVTSHFAPSETVPTPSVEKSASSPGDDVTRIIVDEDGGYYLDTKTDSGKLSLDQLMAQLKADIGNGRASSSILVLGHKDGTVGAVRTLTDALEAEGPTFQSKRLGVTVQRGE